MEVIAQWLDDVDDLVFTLPLAWQRIRIWCLQIGLLSALTLCAIELGSILIDWALTCSVLALASVVIWTIGLLAAEIAGIRYDLERDGLAAGT